MPVPKLSYFNVEGLGEPIRLLFKIANIEFEDNRVNFEDWPAMKATTPNGSMPILEMDGRVFTQFSAIIRHLGRQNGFYPTNPIEQYNVDEVMELINDMGATLIPSVYVGMRPHMYGYGENTPEQNQEVVKKLRIQAMEGSEFTNGAKPFPDALARVDKLIPQTGFINGGKVTIADMLLHAHMRRLESGLMDLIPVDVASGYVNLQAHWKRFREIPEVKAYYKL